MVWGVGWASPKAPIFHSVWLVPHATRGGTARAMPINDDSDVLVRDLPHDHSELLSLIGEAAVLRDQLGKKSKKRKTLNLIIHVRDADPHKVEHNDFVTSTLATLRAAVMDAKKSCPHTSMSAEQQQPPQRQPPQRQPPQRQPPLPQPPQPQPPQRPLRPPQPQPHEVAQRRVLGDEHVLACTLRSIGQHEEAAAMFRTVLKARQRVLGEEHPSTLASMFDLSSALLAAGQHEEAAAMLRTAEEVQRRVLGGEHPETLSSMTNMANALGDAGQHEEAAAMLRTVLERQRRVLGEEHPDTLNSMDNLTNALRDAGQHMEVAPLDALLDAASIDLLVSRAYDAMATDEEQRALQAAASYNDAAADYLVSRAGMDIATDDEQRALCKATAAGNTVALSYLMRLHVVDVASDEQRRAIAQAIRRRWGNTEATYFINGEGFPRELHPGLFGTPDGTSICEQAEKQCDQRSTASREAQAVASASKTEKQREQAVHHHEQGGCVII